MMGVEKFDLVIPTLTLTLLLLNEVQPSFPSPTPLAWPAGLGTGQ